MQNTNQLKIHEWIAIAVLIAILIVILCISLISKINKPPTFARTEDVRSVEVFIKGAVAMPGIYRMPEELPLSELLLLAQVKPTADLRRYNMEKPVRKGRLLNIKEKGLSAKKRKY